MRHAIEVTVGTHTVRSIIGSPNISLRLIIIGTKHCIGTGEHSPVQVHHPVIVDDRITVHEVRDGSRNAELMISSYIATAKTCLKHGIRRELA